MLLCPGGKLCCNFLRHTTHLANSKMNIARKLGGGQQVSGCLLQCIWPAARDEFAGLFDTAASQSEVCNELTRAMVMSQHGIHAILLVLTTSARFTAEEVACLNYLRSAYGGQLLRHCILVFTHGDSLEEEETPLEEFLRNCPESLQVRSAVTHCSSLSHRSLCACRVCGPLWWRMGCLAAVLWRVADI